ncbi:MULTISPECIES: hypothetical protein [Paenibacillus]|uniref:hypothetical protein n=1 Tax=Paenibacillus TaxID=44249 RepID=UPI00038FF628|nr:MULTISPECIES: hypothetical protein [Paenibacillus]ASS68032.1 hypothetical protein CIC07_19265 [Paenibacillus sp. RUD330]KKC48689.1 hypothetical protein VE23_18975 [Paenibacillus sp. D9]CDN45584.1 Putative uncharacterized protein [Paenibacillus sp. P22]SIR41000.1 hypothetical protein SAMN05880555_3694 [Paenibacillus sp. RU4X]SIR51161.1 hypothetical protein SAMN05880570_3696 [Paenibacillus sp. RU4T]
MAHIRPLHTDADFQEALDKSIRVRVFRDDQMIESGSCIVRFDERTVVIQSGVADLAYHSRSGCEFFELRK